MIRGAILKKVECQCFSLFVRVYPPSMPTLSQVYNSVEPLSAVVHSVRLANYSDV